MIENIFLGSIAKDAILEEYSINSYLKKQNFIIDPDGINEDYWNISESKLKFALSDGATESYNSKLWAKLLCDNFVTSNDSLGDWLSDTIKKFSLSQNVSSMTWSQHLSYERGSFATFIGGELDKKNNQLILNCIGDSYIFLLKKEASSIKFKYKKKIKTSKKQTFLKKANNSELKQITTFDIPNFNTNPDLLSNNHHQNNHDWQKLTKKIKLEKNNIYYVVACTDAFADWLINEKKVLIDSNNELLKLIQLKNTKEDFSKYFFQNIMKGRKDKSMKIDDSTLFILKIVTN